jgi:hypothetical protein
VPSSSTADVEAAGADKAAVGANGRVPDWNAGAAPRSGDAAEYEPSTSGGAAGEGKDVTATAADRRPWLFHLVMALGGVYLAMVTSNWGTANS